MKRRSLRFVPLSLVLALVLAVPVLAADSWDTPNDVNCDRLGAGATNANVASGRSGKMRIQVDLKKKLSQVKTQDAPNGNIALDCPATGPVIADGKVIAKLGMERLCQAAQLATPDAYTCVAKNKTTEIDNTPCFAPLGCACADTACCSDAAVTDVVVINCAEPDGGFDLSRTASAEKFDVSQVNNPNNAINGNSTAGNSVGPDLLTRVLVRVDPQGTDGIVTFSVLDKNSPPNSFSFSVDTTGKTDVQLHQQIAAGFNVLGGLGLQAMVIDPKMRFRMSPFGQAFETGKFVSIPNANAKVQEVLVKSSVAGQNLVIETNSSVFPIPALSKWGLLFLAITLLAGMWLFLRRRGLQQA